MSFSRTFLYHRDYPKGIIFENEDEYKAALASGAVEAPWLVNGEKEPEKEKEEPATTEPLKPWQRAQAARKANLQKRKEGVKLEEITI